MLLLDIVFNAVFILKLLGSRVQSTVSTTCCLLRKLSPVPEGATKPKWTIIFIVVSYDHGSRNEGVVYSNQY